MLATRSPNLTTRKLCVKLAAKSAAVTLESALRSKTGPVAVTPHSLRKKRNVDQKNKLARPPLRTLRSNKSCAPSAARSLISRRSECSPFLPQSAGLRSPTVRVGRLYKDALPDGRASDTSSANSSASAAFKFDPTLSFGGRHARQ